MCNPKNIKWFQKKINLETVQQIIVNELLLIIKLLIYIHIKLK